VIVVEPFSADGSVTGADSPSVAGADRSSFTNASSPAVPSPDASAVV
jgi:hypothetical protein